MSQPGLFAAASLAAISGALLGALPASAQEHSEARNDLTVIVVSAKDPGQDLLDFAGSGDAIRADELEARQFQDISTLSYASPNVSLDAIGTFKGVANFAIRGLGINSSIPSIDPAVGLFVDGVYSGINAGSVFDMLDVERIDVLRGPQGVAFGRNTTGGAVLVKTADPTWNWEGHARVAIEGPVDGDRGVGMVTARGVISGPLSDRVAIRLGALHSSDGGYFKNGFDGSDFGDATTTVLRGGLTLRATDRLTLLLKGEWTKSNGEGAATHNNGQHPRDSFELAVDEPGFYRSEAGFAMLRADYELGAGVLTNVFGWRDYDLSTRNDIDSSPLTLFHSDTGTNQEQWSNETYYAADYGVLAVTAGAYVFHQDIGYDEVRDLSGLGQAMLSYGGGRQAHDVYGLYAQSDYELAEAITLTAGLRWSREEKSADITYVRPRAACSAIDATCPTSGERVAGENNGFSDSRSWDSLSPRIALAFKPSETSNLYGSWTRGFRSGGYNLRITQPAAFEQVAAALGSPAFDEEKVDTFEIGTKWQSSDGLAQLNGAVFWTEVKGLQREVNVPSLTSGLAQSVYNTADARIRGGEVEATLAPAPGLTLSANAGYTDAEYRSIFFDLNSDNVIDAADLALELPRAPKWTWGGSARYEAELGGLGTLGANVFFQHRDAYAYTDNNWGFNSASDRLDASLSLELADPAITLTLFGRNLLDEVQFGGDTQLPFAGGDFSNGINAPFDPHPAAGTFSPVNKGRVLGVELAADF
jgi:iron complex outermembrane receptor protein